MRRAARTDANHGEVTKALRKCGWSVLPIHTLGKGAPDLLVGAGYQNFLLEVKDGTKPPSAQKLTPDEEQFHRKWYGSVFVVTSAEDAVNQISMSITF